MASLHVKSRVATILFTANMNESMNFPSRHPNLNALWSNLILEELWRLGVRDCCIAPGSRSAPLTLAAASHKGLRKHVHFDERGLGFFALGIAKQSLRPVVVITTSGTAVANVYPAVIEAHQANVPLIVITADRPPELIDCGANQAIDQLGIYGKYPGDTVNLPVPTADISTRWLLTSIDQGFARSCQQGLPLHINCMFREPLYPDGRYPIETDQHCCSDWLNSKKPYTAYQLFQEKPDLGDVAIWQALFQCKGIIIVGRMHIDIDVQAVLMVAEAVGWPVLVDIQSQLHGHSEVISSSELLLASSKGKALLAQAESVFQIGGFLVSKRLNRFLEARQWRHYVVLDEPVRRNDAGHRQTHRVAGPVSTVCKSLLTINLQAARPEILLWSQKLRAVSQGINRAIKQDVERGEVLSELWVAANLKALVSEKTGIFIGNSLAVRLMDTLSSGVISNVVTNRGASGIDGLLAAASGCAVALGKPLLTLLGDLSFLHDLNSLAMARHSDNPLIIILLNNDGGGIFNLLPLDEVADQAETYFQTPHGLEASKAAAMFGVRYHVPETREQFKSCLSGALANNGCTIIEVKTLPGQAARELCRAARLAEVQ